MTAARAVMAVLAVAAESDRRDGGALWIRRDQHSRAVQSLDEELTKWRDRPLGETPYLLLDARYEKV